MKRLIVFGLVAVAMVVAVSIGIRRATPDSTPIAPPSSVAVGVPPSPTVAPPPASVAAETATAPARRVSRSARLKALLATSTDWRAFAMEAMRHPEEGGDLYAGYVVDLCSIREGLAKIGEIGTRDSLARTSTVTPQQLQMRAWLAHCAAFTDAELSSLVQEIRKHAPDGRDPLVAANRALEGALRNGDRGNVQAVLQDALAEGDALVLGHRHVLQRTMARRFGNAPPGLHFEGTRYANQQDANLQHAVDVALCADGAPCALRGQMLMSCLSGGSCADDPLAYVADHYRAWGASPDQIDDVARLARRVRDALDRGDASAFVR